MIVLNHANIITPDGIIEDGQITIEDHKITGVINHSDRSLPSSAQVIDLSGKMTLPGFIDVHIHGVLGYEAMGLSLEQVIESLPRFGVTAFLATTITLPEDETDRRISEMERVLSNPPTGADCLGIHIEGPHLSPKRPGMAKSKWFKPLTKSGFDHLQNIANGNIRMITFAPEEGDAINLIPYLRDHNVVPVIGHSDADFEFVMKAVELGLDHATHTFNAMPPFHHRNPGVIGAVLASDRIYAQLIADGHHVHPGAMRVLLNAKGVDKTCLISDAAPYAGSPEGEYEWDEYQVVIKDGTIRSPEGVLSGAYSMMNDGFFNLIHLCGLTPVEASRTASLVPARSIGVDHYKGMIKEDYDADLVIMDDDYQIKLTLSKGKIVWEE